MSHHPPQYANNIEVDVEPVNGKHQKQQFTVLICDEI
jgi:hypothetical protein